jgi:hypothetical protein
MPVHGWLAEFCSITSVLALVSTWTGPTGDLLWLNVSALTLIGPLRDWVAVPVFTRF